MNKITTKITNIIEHEKIVNNMPTNNFQENPIFQGDYKNSNYQINQKISEIISNEKKLKQVTKTKIAKVVTNVFIGLIVMLIGTYYMTIKYTSPITLTNNKQAITLFEEYITNKVNYDKQVKEITTELNFALIAQEQIDAVVSLFEEKSAARINTNNEQLAKLKNFDLTNFYVTKKALIDSYQKISEKVEQSEAVKEAIANSFVKSDYPTKISSGSIVKKININNEEFETRSSLFDSKVIEDFVSKVLEVNKSIAPLIPFFENKKEVTNEIESALNDYAAYHGTQTTKYLENSKVNLKNIILDYQVKINSAMQEAFQKFQIVHYDELFKITQEENFELEAKKMVNNFFN